MSDRSSVVIEVTASLADVGRARGFVATASNIWGYDDLTPQLTLLTSETVTNAIEHGVEPISLRLTRLEDGVRVAVNDAGRALPIDGGLPHPRAESGRGVAIVRALASDFGVEMRPPNGKAVWFDLRRSA